MAQLLLTVAGLTVAGLLSPGPNFVLVTGRALSSGGRLALATATGVSLGSMTHAIFGIAGFGALLRSSESLFTAAKLLGAGYLVWVGFKSVRCAIRARQQRGVGSSTLGQTVVQPRRVTVSIKRSLLDGYRTQMSNPKSTLFFLALFTTAVPADTTVLAGVAVIATIVVLAFVGYSTIALVFSRPVFQSAYQRIGYRFDALFGVLMIALGVRVSLAQR